MRKNHQFRGERSGHVGPRNEGGTVVLDQPEPIVDVDAGIEKIVADKKPAKKRLPPTGEYGKLHASREEADKFPVAPAETAENNPFGIWQYSVGGVAKVVWAKNKQEAVYLCMVPQHKVDKVNDKGEKVGYSFETIDDGLDAERLDAERKGRQRKLVITEVTFLLQLLELNDAEKFAKVAALVPHMVPYFPVEHGGLGRDIPVELAENPLAKLLM